MDSVPALAKVSTGIATIVLLSYILRGLGRAKNDTYSRFVQVYQRVIGDRNDSLASQQVRKFDFDFEYFPTDFTSTTCGFSKKENAEARNASMSAPCKLLAYLAIHTFGIKMIYPGSIKLIQSYLQPMLLQGRTKLIEEDQGTRYKLRACDDNEIDTIFVDNRGKHVNGRTLVLCSEGNAGFYEIGIMSTPLALKYSVLGWNHPGFGGSTGAPYPVQDRNAVEAVMQFAMHQLHFEPKDIILYGWSIGAFSTLSLAIQHTNVKGLILDATFDDILPLALPKMPQSVSSIVRLAIREHMNLHNSELLKQYHGPVILIRRTEDEIICSE